MVYYINSSSYKYAVAFSDKSVYQPNKIYYTIDKALQAGKESIKIAIGY